MAANRPGSPRMASEGMDKPRIQKAFGAGEQKLTRIEQERGRKERGAHPRYRVLQCYIAWPAGTELRFRVLHRVLQSATHGATFSKSKIRRKANVGPWQDNWDDVEVVLTRFRGDPICKSLHCYNVGKPRDF